MSFPLLRSLASLCLSSSSLSDYISGSRSRAVGFGRWAKLGALCLLLLAGGQRSQAQSGIATYTAPPTLVGSTVTSLTANVTITAAGTSAAGANNPVRVLTQGVAGLDFNLVTGGTCSASTAYYVGDVCSVEYSFTPTHPWSRFGGVEVVTASGAVLGSSYITGIGNGPQTTFGLSTPAAPSLLGGGFYQPAGIAVDAGGNVYVDDQSNKLIKEIPAGCLTAGCATTLGGGLNLPTGMAVDGLGNVYVADPFAIANLHVVEIPPGCASSSCMTVLGGGFSHPASVAVDGSGNVYVGDFGTSTVTMMPAGCLSSSCVTVIGGGYSNPEGVAVDAGGNVYVADQPNHTITKIIPGCTNVNCVTTIGGGFSAPVGVAVDGTGNVYVTDVTTELLTMIPPGCLSASCVVTLAGGYNYPAAVAVDGSGNLYVTDQKNDEIKKIDMQDAPRLSFADTSIGNSSAQQIVTLGNNGNMPLTISALTETNASLAGAATTCAASGAGATVAAGGNCVLGVEFVPAITGPNTGSAGITDNTLNASATQSIALAGAGLGTGGTAQTITFPAPTAVVANGVAPITLTATASSALAVYYTVTGPATLSGSTLTITGAGTVVVTAHQDGDATYSPAPSVTQSIFVSSGAVEPVGTTSGTLTATVTITTAGKPKTITVSTQGVASLDFSSHTGGNCSTSTTYIAGAQCTESYTFKPTHPWARYGSIQLTDTSGNILGTTFISGTGTGPQATFSLSNAVPVALKAPSPNYSRPRGLAVDAGGNVYVADEANVAVYEVPASGGTVTTVGNSNTFAVPYSVAVDGAGNVYVTDVSRQEMTKMPKGCLNSNCAVQTSDPIFSGPVGIAVDGSGNVYVSDAGYNRIVMLPAGCFADSCSVTLGGGFSSPYGVAVDTSGDVYVADSGNHAVKEIPQGCLDASCVVTLGGGFTTPDGVAVDGVGNVYVADVAGVLAQIPPNCFSASCVTTTSTGFTAPFSVAIDGSGNLYVSDTATLNMYKIDVDLKSTLTLTFPGNTFVGRSTAQQVVTLANDGNMPLALSTLTSTNGNFTGAGTTCIANGTVAAGASCGLGIEYAPTTTGSPRTGTASIKDNSLNASTTQTIQLTGTAIANVPDTTTTTVGLNPATVAWGGATMLNATVADTITPAMKPVGSVTFYDTVGSTTSTLGSATVTNGVASLSYNVTTAGANTITAAYTTSNTTLYAASSDTTGQVLTVNPRPVVTGITPASGPITGGTAVTITGTSFTGLTGVMFGSSAATNVVFVNATTVTAVAPADALGIVDITVITDSTSATSTADQFAYIVPPSYTPNTPVGSTVTNLTAYITITAAGTSASTTIAAVKVVTQGATGLDFNLVTGGTCAANTVYSTGDVCSVEYSFTPLHPWARFGGIEVVTASGAVLGSSYLSGIGTGPQATFSLSTLTAPSTLGGGFDEPTGLAVDASGNIYVADQYNSQIKEMPAGCLDASCTTTLGSGYTYPVGIAVDGLGNVYVANPYYGARLVEMPPGCADSSCMTNLGGGFNTPDSVAIDGSGNVYVADFGTHAVTKMPPGCLDSSCVTTIGGGYNSPQGVAVDVSGNVYVADQQNGTVTEIPPGCIVSTCVVTLGGGFGQPDAVAVDGGGNVYVTDVVSESLMKIPPGCFSASCVVTLGGNYSYPAGIALDGSGNLYVSDQRNNHVKKIDVQDAPSLSFASTPVGSSSAQQVVTLGNNGNMPLTVSALTGNDASFGGAATSCSSTATVAAEGTCLLGIEFAPASPGAVIGSASITDNTLNAGTTQVIALIGTGVGTGSTAQTITFPPLPSSVSNGVSPLTLTATASSNLAVYYTVTGPATVSGSTLTITGAGAVVVTANQDGDATYAPAPSVTQSIFVSTGAVLPVGTLSGTLTATMTFTASVTLNATLATAIQVTTQGISGLEFNYLAGGTCVPGGTYDSTHSCTVNYTFEPAHPWARLGGIVLMDGAGNIASTAFLGGLGTGPQTTFSLSTPSIPVVLGSGYVRPRGIAVDAAGNVFIPDSTSANPAVYELLAAGGYTAVNTLGGGGFGAPYSVAVDGSGNVYITDSANVTKRQESCLSSNCVVTLAPMFAQPVALAADSSGNVYVSDLAYHRIAMLPAGCLVASCSITLGGGFNMPYGVAVDKDGNVYVADEGNHAVNEIPQGCVDVSCVVTLGGGFSSPTGVAVDGLGNVYVADISGTVSEMSPNCFSTACMTAIGSGFVKPFSIAVDGSGNLYVSDIATLKVSRIDVQDAPSLAFASTYVGSSSAQQVVTLGNNGNMPLTISALTGTNASFAGAGTTCSISATLAAGAGCGLGVEFVPTAVGSPLTGSGNITDNDLYINPNPTQIIQVSGTSLAVAPTVATVSAVSAAYGATTGITVTATESGAGGVVTGGVVTFGTTGSVGGSFTPATCTLVAAGTCTTVYTPSGTLAAGAYTNDITASFAAVGNYSAASSTNDLSITTIAPATAAVSAVSAAYGAMTGITVTATESGAGGVVTGGLVTFGITGSVGGSFNPATCTLVAAGTCTTVYTPSGTLAAGTYSGDITASFAAVGNYTAASTTSNLSISTVAPVTATLSGVSTVYGSTTGITVTATENGTAGVVTGGVVTFGTSGSVGGSFNPATCTLIAAGTCTTVYTPSGTLAAGSYTADITATFATTGNYTAANASGNLTITSIAPGTTTVSAVSSAYGSTTGITVTATESGTAGVVTGGVVTFGTTGSVGGSFNPATCTLTAAGTCTTVYTPSGTLAAGSYAADITASFAAVGNYSAATSTGNLTITSVAPAVTMVSAISSAYGSTTGITVTATESGTAGVVTGGVVTFGTAGSVGGSFNPASCTLIAAGTCTTVYTPSGTLAAGTYSGDITSSFATVGNYSVANAANNLSITTVAPITSTVSAVSVAYGSTTGITVTAAESGSAGVVTGGIVTFGTSGSVGGSFNPATCTLTAAGTCTTVYTPSGTLAAGTYNSDITASFATVGNYTAASTTSSLSITTVAPLAAIVSAVSSAYGSTTGITVTATESGAGGVVTGGVVTFVTNGSVGGSFNPATCTLTAAGICTTVYTPSGTLAVGTYASDISGSFAATGNYAAANASGNLTITSIAPATTTVSAVSSAYGSTTGITVTAAESGTAGVVTGGVVTFGTTGSVGGSFNPATCTLTAAGTCTTVYTPSGTLAAGSYAADITATFAAVNNYSAATSMGNLTITSVAPAATMISAVSSAYGSTTGITVTATESGTAGVVTGGVVTFGTAGSVGGSFNPATCTLTAAGTCTTVYTPSGTLAAGSYAADITASFAMVGNYTAASTTSNLSISTVAPVAAALSGVSTAYGSTTGITVTATENGTAGVVTGGVVTFGTSGSVGGSFNPATCTLTAAGTCTTVYAPSGTLAAGTYNSDITASFATVGNYTAASTTSNLSISTVAPVTATVSAVSSAYGSVTGITVTATESGSAGVVTGGIVTFGTSGSVGGSFNPATCTLIAAGTCTTVYTPSGTLAAGAYTGDITATFAKVGNYSAASATSNLSVTTIAPITSTVSVVSSAYGSATGITVTATESGTAGIVTGGVVTFGTSGGVGGSFSPSTCTLLVSGTCTTIYTPSTTLAAGTYSNDITASFAAVGNYSTSSATSNLSIITVAPAAATVSAVSSAYGSTTGITITATESGTAGVVTNGIVTFGTAGSVGGSFVPASCTLLAAGTCTTVYTPSGTLAAGVYNNDITASFAAVTNYTAASATSNLSVSQRTPVLTLSNVVAVTYPSNSNLSVSLAWTGSGAAPTGAVTFSVDSGAAVNASCTGTVTPVTCIYSGSFAVGPHTLNASYAADTNYAGTSAAAGSFTVLPNTSKLVFGISPATPLTAGGNGGSAITVQEENPSSAIVTTATDPINLAVTGPVGFVTKLYGPTNAIAGVASFNVSAAALTVPGTYTYTATFGSLTSAVASETVNPAVSATTAISSTTLTENHPASAFTPVTGAGGTGTLSYSVLPVLPTGLSFNSGTGTISGTPSVISAATVYTVTVTDTNSATSTATFSLTVNSAVIAAQSVASTTLTQNHLSPTFTPVTATGGTGTLTYSVLPALPTGLSMSVAGSISGTPTATSTLTAYAVTVTDSNGATTTASFNLTVNSAVAITTSASSTVLTANHLAAAFTPVTGAGGTGALTYSVLPVLPSGLSMATTGAISGTPTVTSPLTAYTVTVTDINAATATATFNLTVSGPVSATTSVSNTTLTESHASTAFTPVTGTGGTGTLTYSVLPVLPTGLSFSTAGVVSGTPTVTSTATIYTVTVTDTNSATATATFSLTVTGSVSAATAVSSTTLTENHVAASFTPVTGAGGTGTLIYSVLPTLPTGLSFSTAGVVSGTPIVTSAASNYTVTVTDANSATATATFSLTVTGSVSAVTAISSTTLTQNHLATTFSPVTGAGGTGTLTYSVLPALPTGLSFSTAGVVSGTPTATSPLTAYTVTVTDSNAATATATFNLTVTGSVSAITSIPGTTLTESRMATAFTPVTGTSGTGTLTYSVLPALPMGLSFSTAGVVSGTPTVTSAAITYTVTVTDANAATATATFNLTVSGAVSAVTAISSTTLTESRMATAFTPVTGTGGTAALTYSVLPALPAGLSFSTAGVVSGTPTVTSVATIYTVTVTDVNAATATATFSLAVSGSVSAAISISSTTLTQDHAATAFTPVTGTGGTGTLTYSVFPALPTGLSFSTAGVVSGTPTVASAATNYTVTVTDANSATATATFSLTISGPVVATQAVAATNLIVNQTAMAFTPVLGSGGFGSLIYSVLPVLPAGLSFASSTGTITGTPTVTSVTATYAVTVTDTNHASTAASFSLTVTAEAPTILFTVPNHTYGDAAFSVSASSNSTGAFTYSIVSGPATITGNTVTITNAGLVVLQAAQAAEGDYTAGTQNANFTVSAEAPTITFAVPNHAYGDAAFGVSASSNSTGAFTYSVVSGPATITGSTVTLTGGGTVTLQASEAADANYSAATKNASFAISTATLTIKANDASRLYGAANPAFTGSVGGAQPGDNLVENFTTSATMLSPVATYAIVPSVTGPNVSSYTENVVNGTLTIAQAPTSITLSASSIAIASGQNVTFTAQVSPSTSGMPTGIVTVLDNGGPLTTLTLAGGSATYVTTALSPGIAHVLTAVYGGDSNFLGTTASGTPAGTVTVTVGGTDTAITPTSGTSFTLLPGGALNFSLLLTPQPGAYPGPVTFSISGLPPGATATFTPQSLSAITSPTTVQVTIQTAASTAKLIRMHGDMGVIALGLLLIPVGCSRRTRKRLRKLSVLAILLGGVLSSMAITGCGSNGGFFRQASENYTLIITATSGSVKHVATITLNIQ